MSRRFNKNKKLSDIYAKELTAKLRSNATDIIEFRNVQHFKTHLKTLNPSNGMPSNTYCGITFKDGLKELLANKSQMEDSEYELIFNNVKNVLHKRGLLSENVYESYKYTSDTTGVVDVSKVIAEDPECFLTPNTTYKNFFYELYVSISYNFKVPNKVVIENLAKILATVQLLEKQHIYIKITVVLPIIDVDKKCSRDALIVLPAFSHRDVKDIKALSSLINDRLLRKYMFAILENTYGEDLHDGYGMPVKLECALTPVNIKVEDLCANILNQVIEPGERK